MYKRITGFGYRSKTPIGQKRHKESNGVPVGFAICLILLQASLTYIAVDISVEVQQRQQRSESHE